MRTYSESKKKKCKICKKEFKPFNSLQKYCSIDCSMIGAKKLNRKRAILKSRPAKQSMIDWAKDVKERAGYKCEYCGSKQYLNSHHIFSRSNKSVRTDLDNGICLCAKHHIFSNEFSAHKTGVEFTYWLEKYKGKEFMDRLRKKAMMIDKYKNKIEE